LVRNDPVCGSLCTVIIDPFSLLHLANNDYCVSHFGRFDKVLCLFAKDNDINERTISVRPCAI
jgi:hypothetical protein